MTTAQVETPRAVIVISSHVVRGSVGNRAAVFALETLGHPVWAVPTVTLPWHPGHGPATRIVPDPLSFAAMLDDLARTPWLGEVAAILTGYFGDAEQVEAAARLVEALKRRNPGALYLCDPIMGDAGGLYVGEPVAAAIGDRLMPLADIATPNRYELEWMCGRTLGTIAALVDAAREAGPATMLVTSAPALLARSIANLLVTPTSAMVAEHRVIEPAPNGLGDLASALFLARLLDGASHAKALQSTTQAVFEILARTTKRGADELTLETDAQSLVHPMAMVTTRQLSLPGGGRRA